MNTTTRLFAAALFTALVAGCSAAPDASDPNASSEEDLSKARFTSLKGGPTNAHLHALWAAGNKLDNAYVGTYRFNKPGSEKTDEDARMNRVKEVMHRYMCSFFDESIDIGHESGKKAVATVLSDVDMENNASDQDKETASFSDALADVLADTKLDVMSGGASGNNTGGEVMGVYDITHNEIFYFGYTNCGSDD